MSPTLRRSLAVCGILAPAVFCGAAIAGASAQGRYDSRREDLSALAALDARHGWIMIAGTIAMGALIACLALAVGGGRLWTLAAAPLLTAGLATAAAGMLRIDCSERVDANCEARSAAGQLSWHDSAHNAMAALIVLAFAIAPLATALHLRGAPGGRRLAIASLATSLAVGLLAAVYFWEPLPAWSGVVERSIAAVALTWVAAVGVRVLRRGELAAARAHGPL
jgi:hypothetical membrane protein